MRITEIDNDEKKLDLMFANHKKWMEDKIDGVRAEFCGANFSAFDLKKYDCRFIFAFSCMFYDMDLSGINFNKSDLQSTIFKNCNLKGATFEDANLAHTKFYDCIK